MALVLGVALSRAFQLSDKLEELGEQVEESLDLLDGCYRTISGVSQTPVLSDEPTVRLFVENVKLCRDAVQLVANKLVSFDKEDDEDEKNSSDTKA
jgi:hypothetical protein